MDIPEIGFIMVLALILFGPEELPNIARKAGRIVYEIKKAANDVQQEVRESVEGAMPQNPVNDIKESIKENITIDFNQTPDKQKVSSSEPGTDPKKSID